MEQSGERSRVLCWELVGLVCFAEGTPPNKGNQGKSREIKGNQNQGKSREIKIKGNQEESREIKGNQEESRGVKGINVNRGKTR